MNNEKNYEYDFSVVMAVYNVEEYLHEAINSLVLQDLGFSKIQLILVNDGSTDGSGAICDEYAAKYPENIVVIHKSNGGVASARNEGLKHATGHFLNFMDSDDKISSDAFRKVYRFFCEHEEETDVVTIPIELFDGASGPHWQNWKFENGSRVINLAEEYETTVMFVTASFFHNRVKKSIIFDPHLVVAEDVKVLLTVLADKMTLGVIDNCVFYYRRRSTNTGLIQTSKKKKGWYFDYFDYFVDWVLAFYREKYSTVPGFVQFELLSDLQWRVTDQSQDSEVLSKEEQQRYNERLCNTFRSFADKYIISQKLLEEYQKCFILKKKYGRNPDMVLLDGDVALEYGETKMQPLSLQPVELQFIKLGKQAVSIEGAFYIHGISDDEEMPMVCFLLDEQIVTCNCRRRDSDDRYCLGEKAQLAIGFQGKLDLEQVKLPLTVRFAIQYQNMLIELNNLEYGEFAPIGTYQTSYYYRDGIILQPIKKGIQISKAKYVDRFVHEFRFLRELWKANQEGTRKAVAVRMLYRILKTIKRKPVWLLSDRIMKAGDNGEAFYRFLLQQDKKNIDLRFLLSPKSPDYPRAASMGKVVPIPSFQYKMLYLISEYIISSHADNINTMPFHGHQDGYRDIVADRKFVFLQHGVTMNDVSEWLARQHRNLSAIVTAASPEYESFIKGPYGYTEENIWLTGFPRYDYLPGHSSKKQVTIAPTWRAYLTPQYLENTGERRLTEDFINSDYLKYYNCLLNHKKLLESAEKYGYQIAFYPHPNVQSYLDVFQKNARVSFLGREYSYQKVYEESSLMVTDYSSVIFDFAYLEKPVIYTQFDKDQFFSGGHICSSGYFNYERDGFGEVEYDLESTVDRIIEYMENGCQMKQEYKERARHFFAFHDRNNSRRVFEKLMQDRQKE